MRVLTSVSSALYYLTSDHLSSTSLTMDATGNVVARQMYLPYGQVRSTTGVLPTDKGFTGQRLDATGLTFYNARYYDATLGRFISADTVIPGSENPQALNRYSYSIANPLNYIEPSGHAFTLPCIFLCTPVSISGWLNVNGAALGCLVLNCHVTRVDDNIWDDPWGGQWEIRNNGPILPMPMALEAAPLEEAVSVAGQVAEDAVASFSQETSANQAAGTLTKMPASQIKFTQSSISWATKNGVPLDTLTDEIANGKFEGSIRVVKLLDQVYSIDNRRLAAFKLLDMDVPVKFVDLSDPDILYTFVEHFTTPVSVNGEYILVRGTDVVIN